MTVDVTATLVGFARTLRSAGVAASPDRVHAMLDALRHLEVSRRTDVYWAGRLTLCAGPEDLARYDAAFAAYFAGEVGSRVRRPPPLPVVRPVALPGEPPAGEPGPVEEMARVATTSRVEVLRTRDFAGLDRVERSEVARLMTLLDPLGPPRRSRRRRPAGAGPVDAARTVRATLRRGGEPARLLRHATTVRPRRLVLLLDVSGSMTPYADAYLRFAHAAARRRPSTEVFTVGTRLTRVTREIRARDADTALAAVALAVPDWSGGTRLGDQISAFLDRWGQRGTARGAVVVVASDGWERGDASALGEAMARLHRLAYRVVWVNPHKGRPGYAPVTAGMAAALPHVDDFVEGHSLAALEQLATLLSGPVRSRA